jgi:hypothetical protein
LESGLRNASEKGDVGDYRLPPFHPPQDVIGDAHKKLSRKKEKGDGLDPIISQIES